MKPGLNELASLWVKNNLMAKIKIQIFGKVQGVFFRHSARQQALSLNLNWLGKEFVGWQCLMRSGRRKKIAA